MARKKDSAAKQMHAATDPWDQCAIANFGGRYDEIREGVDLLSELVDNDELGNLENWVRAYGVEFFRCLIDEAKAGNPKTLRKLLKAAELTGPMPEPWRRWLVARYKLPFKTVMVDGVCRSFPMSAPDTIAALQQALADKFNVHLDDRKLRAELRALGVPFAPTKRGRPPVKPARGKKSS